jgi:hypothetical protein
LEWDLLAGLICLPSLIPTPTPLYIPMPARITHGGQDVVVAVGAGVVDLAGDGLCHIYMAGNTKYN